MSLLEFKNVSFRYEGEEGQILPLALDDVNITIEKGEFVAIIGHNGSGKSTLSKLANAMLYPTQGKVYVNGLDTCVEDNELAIRTSVGVVLQNPDNQIVATIVEEDVAFGPENLGVPQRELRSRVDNALKSVGMYEYKDHEPHKLSGGQKQRVAIAGVIAMQTECIVLDEPTAMLDPVGRKEVMNTIKKLNKELGISVIFITHFMEEVTQADRVIVIDSGRVLFDSTPTEVFKQAEKLNKIGLDVPQTAKLAAALRNKGVEIPNDVMTPEAFVESFIKLSGGKVK